MSTLVGDECHSKVLLVHDVGAARDGAGFWTLAGVNKDFAVVQGG